MMAVVDSDEIYHFLFDFKFSDLKSIGERTDRERGSANLPLRRLPCRVHHPHLGIG